jgi:Ca2+-transporting ATPase
MDQLTPDLSALPDAVKNLILKSINVNTTAAEVAETKENNQVDAADAKKKDAPPKKNFIGSKTEVALLECTMAMGRHYQHNRETAEVTSVIPFSSDRKRMSTVVRIANRKNGVEEALFGYVSKSGSSESLALDSTQKTERGWLYCKGAAEIVLNCCNKYMNESGVAVELTPEAKASFEALITEMASNALRTIAIAIKPVVPTPPSDDADNADAEQEDEHGLILAGIVGIHDPIRQEVPAAVAACHRAGIVVRMVTGDNVATARSIAKLAGILTNETDDIVMDGPTFRNLSEDAMDQILPKLRVLARSSPMDKQILVNNLKRLGETVAVTGDGTNDAPALKSADVGFSMGIAGTEVAKEASDIVLLDDNFVSLSKAIMWGRSVFDCP